MPSELLALLAAASWAVGALLAAGPAEHLGAFSFVRWRMFFAACMLWSWVLISGAWQSITPSSIGILTLSAIVGMVIGDAALFACMNRLGPRRSGVIFSTHALFSVVLAWLWLDENLWGWPLIGCLLLVLGVMVAVFWGRRDDEDHRWENTHGRLGIGVALGLCAALGQASSTLMLKPLMISGIDPMAGSAVRVTAGFLIHFGLWMMNIPQARTKNPMTPSLLIKVVGNGFLGLFVGASLILLALTSGPANLVGVFSATSPILLLPLLWIIYRRRPAQGAWWGAALAVGGSALVFMR